MRKNSTPLNYESFKAVSCNEDSGMYLTCSVVHGHCSCSSCYPAAAAAAGLWTRVESREESKQIECELGEGVMGIGNGMKELNDVGGAECTNEVEQEGKPHV